MDKYRKTNLALWNERTEIHAKSEYYDVEGFKAGRNSLHSIELEELGDVRGKSLLHLQCHFGMDTLSWTRLGATVTGADFSDKAIALAKSLSEELHIPARFVQTDIYELPNVLDVSVQNLGNMVHWGQEELMRIQVNLPQVKPEVYELPETCPHGCGGADFRPHGRQGERKLLRDTQYTEVRAYRYKCARCGRTFRVYPQGVSAGAQQSQRLKGMTVLLYVLGLSYGAVEDFTNALGCGLGKTMTYHNVQAAGG